MAVVFRCCGTQRDKLTSSTWMAWAAWPPCSYTSQVCFILRAPFKPARARHVAHASTHEHQRYPTRGCSRIRAAPNFYAHALVVLPSSSCSCCSVIQGHLWCSPRDSASAALPLRRHSPSTSHAALSYTTSTAQRKFLAAVRIRIGNPTQAA